LSDSVSHTMLSSAL